jgi:hypothetical protein
MKTAQATAHGTVALPETRSHRRTTTRDALGLAEFTPEWKPPMTSSSPTMVVALYRLRPDQKAPWLETWQQLAAIARSIPECRTFSLELDPDEPNQCRVVSTWSSGSAFDRFVRDVGLLWIERNLDYSRMTARYARFALPNRAAAKPVEKHLTHASV